MTLDEATRILSYAIAADDSMLVHVVRSPHGWDGDHLRLQWPALWPQRNPGVACLDGDFTADELEAMAVWMRAHQEDTHGDSPGSVAS